MKETYERDIQKRSVPQTHLHLHLSMCIKRDSWKTPTKETYERDLWQRPMKETYEKDLWKRDRFLKLICTCICQRVQKETYLTNVCEKRPIQEKKKETNPSETPALAFARVLVRCKPYIYTFIYRYIPQKHLLLHLRVCLHVRLRIFLLVLMHLFRLKRCLCVWKETYEIDL